MVGVVVCPIASGDTAFRSARLTLADWFRVDQNRIETADSCGAASGVGAYLTQLNFDVIWRYFSWSNQTLAMIALWAAAVYLRKMWKISEPPGAFPSSIYVKGEQHLYLDGRGRVPYAIQNCLSSWNCDYDSVFGILYSDLGRSEK